MNRASAPLKPLAWCRFNSTIMKVGSLSLTGRPSRARRAVCVSRKAFEIVLLWNSSRGTATGRSDFASFPGCSDSISVGEFRDVDSTEVLLAGAGGNSTGVSGLALRDRFFLAMASLVVGPVRT